MGLKIEMRFVSVFSAVLSTFWALVGMGMPNIALSSPAEFRRALGDCLKNAELELKSEGSIPIPGMFLYLQDPDNRHSSAYLVCKKSEAQDLFDSMSDLKQGSLNPSGAFKDLGAFTERKVTVKFKVNGDETQQSLIFRDFGRNASLDRATRCVRESDGNTTCGIALDLSRRLTLELSTK